MNTMILCQRTLLLGGIFIVLVNSGCSNSDHPPLGRISGKVRLANGNPLKLGVVKFASDEGFGASSPIDSTGSYSLHSQYGVGIPVGTYKIAVTPPDKEEDSETPVRRMTKEAFPEIPMKYREFSSSGLEITIEKGRQEFNVTLD